MGWFLVHLECIGSLGCTDGLGCTGTPGIYRQWWGVEVKCWVYRQLWGRWVFVCVGGRGSRVVRGCGVVVTEMPARERKDAALMPLSLPLGNAAHFVVCRSLRMVFLYASFVGGGGEVFLYLFVVVSVGWLAS